jgi:hypothetical protein
MANLPTASKGGGAATGAASEPASAADAQLPAQLAKAALRRLALDKLEPTPENYARAYQQEQGKPPASGDSLADLIESIVRGIERGGKQWTLARKKESLQRVLGGSRGDANRLQQRLRQLIGNWEADTNPDVKRRDAALDVVRARFEHPAGSRIGFARSDAAGGSAGRAGGGLRSCRHSVRPDRGACAAFG